MISEPSYKNIIVMVKCFRFSPKRHKANRLEWDVSSTLSPS
jgi:hypothetical protein